MRRRVQAQGSALGSYIGELFLRPEGAQGILRPFRARAIKQLYPGRCPGLMSFAPLARFPGVVFDPGK